MHEIEKTTAFHQPAQSINTDLLNAKGILLIPSEKEPNRTELAKKMEFDFKKLNAQYAHVTAEEKLFLVSLAMNLAVYYFQLGKTQEETDYCEALQKYYEAICQEVFLNTWQKAKWSVAAGKAYHLLKNYGSAIELYKKAIIFENTTLKNLKKTPEQLLTVQEYYLVLVELNLKQGIYFQQEDPAPDLARDAFKEAIVTADEALCLGQSTSTTKIYYLKAQALAQLAAFEIEQERSTKAVHLFITAIVMDISGLNLTTSSINYDKYLKHITACIRQLLKIVSGINKKEQSTNLTLCLKQLSDLTKTEVKNLRDLNQIAEKLVKCCKPTNSISFWQKSSTPIMQKALKPEVERSTQDYLMKLKILL